jgi:5-methylcytosine-specific restriction endonuclease McrA
VARRIVERLRLAGVDRAIRVHQPRGAVATNSDGWYVAFGSLGRERPRLEVWMDHFAGFPQRRYWFGFYSASEAKLRNLAKRVSSRLRPHRVLTSEDTVTEPFVQLTRRLLDAEFGQPFLETYETGNFYYGIYDPLPVSQSGATAHVVTHATAFFADVARAIGRRRRADPQRDDYAHVENRRYVANHIARERSQLLPMQSKLRDNFTCRICGMQYRDAYGELGAEFAEAHHVVPLGKLKGSTRTRLEDLITVCANCHRMLHRMSGSGGDIPQLKRIVRRKLADRRR